LLIRDRSPTFKNEWKIEHPSRKAIILPLIDRIKSANSIDDLEHTSSCDKGIGVCFIYNFVGKLYFKHNDDLSVTLLKYIFANH